MALTLKINVVDLNLVKTINFDPKSTVLSACEQINKKLQDTSAHKQFKPKEYGLFYAEDDPRKGVWLEPGRTLEYYVLKDHNVLEFKSKMRTLRVRMLDGTIKTVFIDDSQPVANLMVVICTKIGITNHDEYSLVRENVDKSDKENVNSTYSSGTLTLKKTKDRERDRSVDSKMEQLKKKLKTDDDLNWVDQSKTLREQGIDDDETLLLRRKFFYSDQNIDSRDPVQLNLLYVQTRDAIVQGTHPVTIDQACQFAGIQCQIQYGNYDESKHKSGFLDLKELLPRDYVKVKHIEKRIFSEHSKYAGCSDLDAKVKYVQLARSLKTYGVTFFLVKEKMQGKNKLVPRLLGVTKDSVLRLDEQTKNILETWPLNTVKRWAASPNSFTLDFGDYKQSYFSVQTTEGEQISQLIAGYIDIILKRKKAKDHFGIDGDEGSTMVEDSVSPFKATILQHQSSAKPTVIGSIAMPAVMRLPQQEPPPIYQGSVPETRVTTIKGNINIGYAGAPQPRQPERLTPDMTDGEHGLLGIIEAAKETIKEVEKELEIPAEIPDLGEDTSSLKWKQVQLDVKKQNVVSQLHAISGASAALITQTAKPLVERDIPQIGAAVQTITSNLPELSKDLKIIGALMNDKERDFGLIDAARRLCRALDEMLRGISPDSQMPRMEVLKSASKIGETSQQILADLCNVDEFDKETYDILLKIAKGVATAAASLVLKAKDIAKEVEDQNPEAKNRIISSARQCALASHQLVACTKVVAPTIKNSTCQRQLTDTCKEVSRQVEGVVTECKSVPQDINLGDLIDAARKVGRALDDMLGEVNIAAYKKPKKEEPVEAILEATDKLFSSEGDANEMVRQAKVLAQATTELINDIKGEAKSHQDSSTQNRLLEAARELADQTSKLVDAAKSCVSNPHDSKPQLALKQAAESLRVATNNAASNAIKNKQIKDLYLSARQCTQVANQTVAAIHGASGQYTNESMEEEIKRSSAKVSDMIPQVVEGMINLAPENRSTQMEFVKICERFVGPAQELASISRSIVGTVKSESSVIQLTNASRELQDAVSSMRTEIERAQPSNESELDTAIDTVKRLIEQVHEYKLEANRAQLRPLPGESSEHCIKLMNSQCKEVNQAMSELLSAGSTGNEQNIIDAARELSSKLRNLLNSVRGVASTTQDNDLQMRILDNTKSVLVKSIALFEETKWALTGNFSEVERSRRLSSASQHVEHALSNCVYCLPGQRDIDESVRTIIELSEKYNENQLPISQSNRPYGELLTSLQSSANRLLEQASNIVEQYQDQSLLVQASKQYSEAYKGLYNASIKLANSAKASNSTSSIPSHILSSLQLLASCSSKLLIASKNAASDPQNAYLRSSLHAACKSVTDAVNVLISHCVVLDNLVSPECDASIRRIQSSRLQLNNVQQPLSSASYFVCMEQVAGLCSKLTEQLTNLSQSLNDQPQCVQSIKASTTTICNLIEKTAHSAYLIGSADPSSIAGKPALVNIERLQLAYDQIEKACKQLTSRDNQKHNIIKAATKIAEYTSEICNSSRTAANLVSGKDFSNQQLSKTKKSFVQLAKDVASATANLVKEIKLLDQDLTNETYRQSCEQATIPLMQSITNLIAFASSPDFAGIPAKLSLKARENQMPVIDNGQQLSEQSIDLFKSIKQQFTSDYANTHKAITGQVKQINSTCKRLIETIKEASPGQRDCDRAIDTLTNCIREIDQTSLIIISQASLGPKENTSSIQTYRENLCNIAKELNNKINNVRIAGQSETENIAHSINRFMAYFEPLTQNSISLAQNSSNSKNQLLVLNQTKAICENALHLMYSVKQCAGNPNAGQLHIEINEAANLLTTSLGEMINNLENAATSDGQVNLLIDLFNQNMRSLEDHYSYSNGTVMPVDANEKNFVDFQTKMVNTAKELARIAQDIVVKCNSGNPSPQQLASLTANLHQCYDELSKETFGAISSTGNLEIGNRIKLAVQALGSGCINLIKSAGDCQSSLLTSGSIDTYAQQSTAKAGKQVTEQVGYVLAALQAVSRGTQVCINAVSTIQGIIGDLNTTIMFATSGTLNPANDNDEFSLHREGIIRTARNLTEDTKSLISSTAASQEQLAVSAQNSVETIKQLAEIVKQGAQSFGSVNSEAQVLLLNSVKDVASALSDMIEATKDASGKNPNDRSMNQLKDASSVLVENVSSLLKTVKAVEDEHLRGTRALEATIESIDQELRGFNSGDVPKRKATPEQLMNATKPVTLATSKAVAAGNSLKQEDIIVAANMGRKAIQDLLITVKQAAWATDQQDDRRQVLDTGRECALQYRRLLEIVHHLVSRPMGSSLGMSSQQSAQFNKERQQLIDVSRSIAAAVTMIGQCAEKLKGSDWVNPSDPTVIAESELLGASSSIEAAAMKLASLRPRRTSVRLPHEDMNFDEMILEAAKCITAATAALLKAASAAQRELNAIYGGSTKPAFHNELDGQWSDGLISAARHVAAATHSLVEAANALVQGNASEERLISAAKQVAASTASLLVACKVKSGTDSTAMNRLQQAGNAVKRATEMLVQAAQKAKELADEEDEQSIVLSKRKVPGIAQEIVAREEIIKKEKELEEARGKLALIFKSRYKQPNQDNNGYN